MIFHPLPDIPQNTAASKTVEPNSFIALMCNSTRVELVSDSLNNDLVKASFANVPKLVPNLKGGYFAVKENSKELNELCFEPQKLLTIAELAQLYPGFRSAKTMPFFKVPADNEHVKGMKVNLREDKALHGGILDLWYLLGCVLPSSQNVDYILALLQFYDLINNRSSVTVF